MTKIDSKKATPIGWGVHLDELKIREKLKSDAALAEFLGVTRSFISAVRTGRKTVSVELGHKIFERLEKPLSEADFEIFTALRVRRKLLARPDPRLMKLVRKRAAGRCELCNSPAPFLTLEGDPYLEVHFISPLNLGGKQELRNAAALCPNCHRKMDVIRSAIDKEQLLKAINAENN
jgi:transcriptional regulator with XRE-family HTH domain